MSNEGKCQVTGLEQYTDMGETFSTTLYVPSGTSEPLVRERDGVR